MFMQMLLASSRKAAFHSWNTVKPILDERSEKLAFTQDTPSIDSDDAENR